MAVALLGLLLAAVPVIVIPGVLSTFEPIKTTLTGALAIFGVGAVVGTRLVGGDLGWPDVGGAYDRIRGLRGVRRIAVVSLAVSAVVTLLASLFSVSSDTSWFGTLGRGQGTLFVVAVAILIGIGFQGVSRLDGVGTLLRALAIGSVPVAIATILQRFGLDPITYTECDAERIPSTIGNALPGSTYLGIATLVALEYLRQSWVRWRAPMGAEAPPPAPVDDPGTSTTDAPSTPTVSRVGAGGGRRARRVSAKAASAPIASVRTVSTGVEASPGWIEVALLLGGAVIALFAGASVVEADLSRTWVAIPLALAWGGAVARVAMRTVAVPAGLAFGGWGALVALLGVANGLTLSRGPQIGLLAAAAIWVVGCATLQAGRVNLRAALMPVGAVVTTVVVTGASWFIPAVGCGTASAPPSAPQVTSAPARVAPLADAPAAALRTADTAPAVPTSAPTPVPTPAGPTAFDRTLNVLRGRVDFLTDSGGAASLGWRINVWIHAVQIYLGQPPSVEAKARALAAALAGAQHGDVAALNRSPGSRAPGGWWYRIIGYGPESQVFTLATSTTPEIRAVQGEITYDRTHNVILDVLLTTGAVGLVAWAVNLGAAFVLAWRLRRRDASGVALGALAPILTCIFVSGLSGVDATTITLINWVVIAIAIALPPVAAPLPTARRAPALVASTGRRGAVEPAVAVVPDDLARLGIVSGVALAGCVGIAIAGAGANLAVVWAGGAFAGLMIVGLAIAERPFRRGAPDLAVLVVTVAGAFVATAFMTPGWSAMAAGHLARLTQNPGMAKETVVAYAKRAVALDPGQATYRVLAGSP